MESLRPCCILLADVVKEGRRALKQGIEETFLKKIGEDGDRMMTAIRKLNEFPRKKMSPVSKKVEEDLNTSRDSDVMIVEVEEAIPSSSSAPPPQSPAPVKQPNKPKNGHRTPERSGSGSTLKSISSTSQFEFPARRMTERQLIIETRKESPLLTSTPVRPSPENETDDGTAPRLGEIITEPLIKQPVSEQKPKVKLHSKSPSSLQSGKGTNRVPKLKPGFKGPEKVSKQHEKPVSKPAEIPSENKPAVDEPRPAISVTQSSSELTLKLKKLVPKDGVSGWAPTTDPTITPPITESQSILSPAPEIAAKGRQKSPSRSSEHPPSIGSISPGVFATSPFSCEVFQTEPPSTLPAAEKPPPSGEPSPSLVAKKHKIVPEKGHPVSQDPSHKKAKPSTSNDQDGEDGHEDDDQLPDNIPALKQKIGKKKEIIAGLKKRLKSERVSKQKEVDEAKEKLKTLEKDLVTVRGQYLTLAQSKQVAKKVDNSDFECQFCSDSGDSEQEKQHMREEIDGLHYVIGQLNGEIRNRNEKLEDACKQIEPLLQENVSLKSQIESNSHQLEESEKKFASIQAVSTSQKSEIRGLHKSVAILNQNVKDRDKKIEELSAKIEEFSSLKKVEEKEPTEERPVDEEAVEIASNCEKDDSAIVAKLKAALSKARRECIERSELIGELEHELSLVTRRPSSQLEDDLTEALTKSDSFEREIAFLSGKRRELESENGFLKVQLDNLKEELFRVIIDRDVPLRLKECVYQNKINLLTREIETLQNNQQPPHSG